jgi:TPR repeat protein
LRGLPEAQRAFGRLFEEGLGVEVNYISAYTFYGLAARNGDTAAEQHLQSLSGQMTYDQRQQAEVNIERMHQRRLAEQEAQ